MLPLEIAQQERAERRLRILQLSLRKQHLSTLQRLGAAGLRVRELAAELAMVRQEAKRLSTLESERNFGGLRRPGHFLALRGCAHDGRFNLRLRLEKRAAGLQAESAQASNRLELFANDQRKALDRIRAADERLRGWQQLCFALEQSFRDRALQEE